MIPKRTDVVIRYGSWQVPAIFTLIQQRSRLSLKEMFTTFNMGIGLVAVIGRNDVARAQKILRRFRLSSHEIGAVTAGGNEVKIPGV